MSNTSATGGVLVPTGSPVPLEGEALIDFINAWIASITGLDVNTAVRPRWQPDPPNLPATGTNWAAVGIETIGGDEYAAIIHVATDLGSDQLRRHEELEVFTSFYGPLADSYARALRDGSQIAQNREVLAINGIGLVSIGQLTRAPEMVKEKWLQRVDIRMRIRKQVVRNYAVENLLSAGGTLNNEITTETFTD